MATHGRGSAAPGRRGPSCGLQDEASLVYLANQAAVELDYAFVRGLAAGLAAHLAAEHPELLTTAQRKRDRGDRIFLDVNRNAYGQTFICPYALRARPSAPVATPLEWAELGRNTSNGFTLHNIRRRLARKRDPWAGMDANAAAAAAVHDKFTALVSR